MHVCKDEQEMIAVPTVQCIIVPATVKMTVIVLVERGAGEMTNLAHSTKFFLLLSLLYTKSLFSLLSQYSLSTI